MLIRAALTGLAAAALATASVLPAAFANDYKRGLIHCDDFQDTADLYKTADPADPIDSGYFVAYAICLLARNVGDDVRALNMLEVEAKKGDVTAAYILALYTATNGTFDNGKWDNYREAFHAFGRVIHIINQKVNYPEGWADPEYADQYELLSYRFLVIFAYRQFLGGVNGSHNSYRLQSPTYAGNRDLRLRPKYSPYTLHNLQLTIENAEICSSLIMKEHFEKLLYLQTVRYCELMKGYAQRILPLETKRLALLENDSCARDVEVCSEYQEVVYQGIAPLVRERGKETKKVWSMTLASLEAAGATEQ